MHREVCAYKVDLEWITVRGLPTWQCARKVAARNPDGKRQIVKKRIVYLVPGFFGFSHLGGLNYFRGVTKNLCAALEERGYVTEVVGCATQPTGSIPRRSARLLARVVETGGLEAEALHFVGHSTGGLDTRLLLTPGATVGHSGREREIAARTRSVVTISTPHHGTPLAAFFTTVHGRRLLLLLATMASSPQGRVSLYLAGRLMALVARADDFMGRTDTLLDNVSRRMLNDLSPERQHAVWEYLRDIAGDQGAILQLTPEAMHLYNAATADAPGIAYGSILSGTPQPPFAYRPSDFNSARGILMTAVFSFMHTLASRQHVHYPYPDLPEDMRSDIEAKLGAPVTSRTNDAVVPTMSQLHGELLHTALGDHLDVVGQFKDPDDPLTNWLPSGSRFEAKDFRAVWHTVAEHITTHG